MLQIRSQELVNVTTRILYPLTNILFLHPLDLVTTITVCFSEFCIFIVIQVVTNSKISFLMAK